LVEGIAIIIGVVLITEGIVPFFFPHFWKATIKKLLLKVNGETRQFSLLSKILAYKNGQIRFIGFFSCF